MLSIYIFQGGEIMNTNILVTSDIHFEKLNLAKVDSYIDYITSNIKSAEPAMFIIAGDTTDNRNLQVGSFEYLALQKFLISIEATCSQVGTSFVILKGTPSHDGNVLKNITSTILRETIYIEDICVKKINGLEVLFLPQTYGNLEDFELKITQIVGNRKPHFAVFHGMFDFAIPYHYASESQFKLARDVCMRAEFIESQVQHFAVGGHVHEYIKHGEIFYIGKFCNNEGVAPKRANDYGIKKFCIRDDGYNMHPITNPYLEDVVEVHYDINKDVDIEKILVDASKFNTTNTVFVLVTDVSAEANQAVMTFKNVVKPVYLKRRINAELANDTNTLLNQVLDSKSSNNVETENLLKSMYEKKHNEQLPEEVVKKIVGASFV